MQGIVDNTLLPAKKKMKKYISHATVPLITINITVRVDSQKNRGLNSHASATFNSSIFSNRLE